MFRRAHAWDWEKISWVVAIEVGVIATLASFVLPGGDDLYRYYLPFANGCLECGFVPYFAHWLLWPLSLIPPRLAWPACTAGTAAGFLVLCRYTGVNPALMMLSFPTMGQFWLGQIDVIVAAGLVIALLAGSPYLQGLGIVLALVKPQVAGLAITVLLVHQSARNVGRMLLLPTGVLAASLFVFGIDWPLRWLTYSAQTVPVHIWRKAGIDLWPYGLVSLVALILMDQLESRYKTALIIPALATPFLGVYSYMVFLLFRAPPWSVPASYGWLLFFPLWGSASLRLAWLLPAAMLVESVYTALKRRRQPTTKEQENRIAREVQSKPPPGDADGG